VAAAILGVGLSYVWSAYAERRKHEERRREMERTRELREMLHRRSPVVPVTSGSINLLRPDPRTVEGLEVQYGPNGLVRAVRVGAMNSEHKELLLTMDSMVWGTLPNARKQEVLAAARSSWASKMCPSGPDIAYVVLKNESGEVVGRADPSSLRILR
jgi:hypothetical protein